MIAIRVAWPVVVAAALYSNPVIGAESAFQQRENVVYAETDGVGLVMDIFTPTGNKNGLAVVDVISGAWHSDRSKIRDHLRAQTFQILCGKGYTVFAIRPGSITKFSAPEMVDHLQRGIRWVKEHAQEFGIDPDRLGMMGASAGGHLASLAAVAEKGGAKSAGENGASINSRVKAVAVLFPPTDFLDYGGAAVDVRSNERMGQLLRRLAFPQGIDGMTEQDIVQKVTAISPARQVTAQTPPFLLIHGDADPVVPLQQSEVMVTALRNAGVSVKLIVKKGGAHPWPTIHEEIAILANWFDEQLEAK